MRRLFGRVMCEFSRHKLGKWEFINEDNCTIQITCSRCGKTWTKVSHTWQYELIDSADCKKNRICNRCGVTETGIWHTWGVWNYSELFRERKCKDCASTQKEKICLSCGGSGKVTELRTASGTFDPMTGNVAGATGPSNTYDVYESTCSSCNGQGYLPI